MRPPEADPPPVPPCPAPAPGPAAPAPPAVRAFSDIEKSRLRNHVLFASDADLAAANLTAALAAVEARAAATQAAAAASGGGSGSGGAAAQRAEQHEVLDPLQLQVWRALPQQEVHLTYDRERCAQLLELDGVPSARSGGSTRGGSGSAGGVQELPPQHRGGKKAPLGKLGQAQQRQGQQGGQGRQQARPPWVWRKLKEVRERHALAVAHWVAMRTGWSDAFWLA